MSVTKEMFDELQGKVNSLAEQLDPNKVGELIAQAVSNAVKPLTDQLANEKADREAKEASQKTDLVNQIVKANLLSEEAAKAMPLNALVELAEKAKPKKAAGLNSAFTADESRKGFKAPVEE